MNIEQGLPNTEGRRPATDHPFRIGFPGTLKEVSFWFPTDL